MSDTLRNRLNQLLAAPGLADLGTGPRPDVRPAAELDAELQSLLGDARLPKAACDLVRALVLLWHDHLAAAHTISQAVENPDGSFVHAIMHRREPDYGNSKYWWRRVGKHPCFPEIARRAAELLNSENEQELTKKCLPRGEWDAFAFVDACEATAGLPSSDRRVQLLREIQRIESEAALEHFLGRKAG